MPDNGAGLLYLCSTKGIGMTYFEFTMRSPNENKARDFIIATVRLKIDHTVCYSLGNGIHTMVLRIFWSIIKRGIYGVFHRLVIISIYDVLILKQSGCERGYHYLQNRKSKQEIINYNKHYI